jgi:simple sugar transport system permease protein
VVRVRAARHLGASAHARGNWIFAAGGEARAARSAGVPVRRVKVTLFATTAFAAAFVGVMQAVRFTGADALRGEGRSFARSSPW